LSKTYTAEQLVDRCLLIREAQNVVGSALHYDMLAKWNDLYETFWSKADDVCMGVNNGYFKGAAAVKGYYAKKTENAAAVAKFLFEKYPDKYIEEATAENVYGAGYVKPTISTLPSSRSPRTISPPSACSRCSPPTPTSPPRAP
jgi:hypothetical protein